MYTKNTSRSTFCLLYYLNRTRPNLEGECPIYLRITLNGGQTALSIKRNIHPSSWSESGQPIGNTAPIKELKAYMNSINAKLYEHQRLLQDKYAVVTAELLRDSFLGRVKSVKLTILAVFDEHNQEKEDLVGKEGSPATLQKYKSCRNYLAEFIKEKYRATDYPIRDVNAHFIHLFQHFLMVTKSCAHNTTIKYLQNFKRIILRCKANGWLDHDPFAQQRLSLKETDRGYLTEEELPLLMNKSILVKRLDTVRDMFVFSCFTGLAYCDAKSLTKANLVMSGGELWIRTKRGKTGTKVNVPLLPVPLAIIHKYVELDSLKPEDKILPVLSNQKMNAYLKEIGDLCGITKNLTTHLARHTFATTVTLTNGVPIESVSKMLGHTNIKTTQVYARVVDSKVRADMATLESKLQKMNAPHTITQ